MTARSARICYLPLVALFLAAACARDPGFYLGGIQVDEPRLEGWLDAVAAAGLNTISVTDYARQGDWDSADLWWEAGREGIVREIRAAKARGMGVVLVLRVALDHAYERNRFLWHGMILPRTDEELDRWFALYGRFALGWAAIAQREGVDVLMVGSELNALTSTVPVRRLPALEDYYLDGEKQARRRAELLAWEGEIDRRHLWVRGGASYPSLGAYLEARMAAEGRWAAQVAHAGAADALGRINRRRAALDRHWRRLIARVREVYRGRLGYAANFDQYRQVSFWDDLDLLGINAYFPLRDGPRNGAGAGELYASLVAGWRRVFTEIGGFRLSRGIEDRPVLFAELGYTRWAESTLQPWVGAGFSLIPGDGGSELVVFDEQPPDPRERALALRALREVHQATGEDILAGLLYWKLSTQESHREIEPFAVVLGDGDPALAELRKFGDPAAGEP